MQYDHEKCDEGHEEIVRSFSGKEMHRKLLVILPLLIGSVVAQQPTSSPSLQETFDWMTNTLRSDEGNNWYIHHPYRQPYTKEWTDKGINPYHQETIEEFSHQGCQVRFVVNTVDNDMGTLLGRRFLGMETDTFNLKDVDPASIKVTNSCEPLDTTQGKRPTYNCEDEAGLQMEFKTRNAQPLFHRETVTSSRNSDFGEWRVKNDSEHTKFVSDVCTKTPENNAYCDVENIKEKPEDLTSDDLVFHSPAYTKRFIKAFRHAVELCGGKAPTF